MGKVVDSTIYNIGYPVYGAKFLDDSTLLVAGGGGEGNNGIPNKVSALKIDFEKKKVVKRFRELSLDDSDDSPTTLDCANNIILVGCNEGSEKIKSGRGNNHLRKYVFHNEHLKFVASIDLDGSCKPEDYTKLTCLSSDASVAAIASSKVPTVIRIVNPTNLRETYEVETGNDVKDLHFSPDGKVLSYITATTLEVMSVVTGNFIVRETNFDSNWTMSKIRFVDQDNVIIAATLTKGTGIVLIKVSLKSGIAKVIKSKVITSKFKGVTSLDVDASGNFVALAGNENSVVIVTLRNLRIVKFLKQVHNFAITRIVFSPDSKLLASVSAANTVHVVKIAPKLATSQSLMESLLKFLTNTVLVVIIAVVAYYAHEYNLHLKAINLLQTKYKKYLEKNDSSDYFVLHDYPQQTTLFAETHSRPTSSSSFGETTVSFSVDSTVGPGETSADDVISYTTDNSVTDSELNVSEQLSADGSHLNSEKFSEVEEQLAASSLEETISTSITDQSGTEINSEPNVSETIVDEGDIEKENSEVQLTKAIPTGTRHDEKAAATAEASFSETTVVSDIEEDPVTVIVEQAKTETDMHLTPAVNETSSEMTYDEDTVPEQAVSQEKTDDDTELDAVAEKDEQQHEENTEVEEEVSETSTKTVLVTKTSAELSSGTTNDATFSEVNSVESEHAVDDISTVIPASEAIEEVTHSDYISSELPDSSAPIEKIAEATPLVTVEEYLTETVAEERPIVPTEDVIQSSLSEALIEEPIDGEKGSSIDEYFSDHTLQDNEDTTSDLAEQDVVSDIRTSTTTKIVTETELSVTEEEVKYVTTPIESTDIDLDSAIVTSFDLERTQSTLDADDVDIESEEGFTLEEPTTTALEFVAAEPADSAEVSASPEVTESTASTSKAGTSELEYQQSHYSEVDENEFESSGTTSSVVTTAAASITLGFDSVQLEEQIANEIADADGNSQLDAQNNSETMTEMLTQQQGDDIRSASPELAQDEL
ncbi:unnamed protein product [Kluyveromyces dobzhanskii CBS 2104]|uniref:Guanine nucleotide-exchange factor SEC12 n=1 Tax=Kluyveromyces dobzhanskii CBS 2104 TaxID=1427455 RepID=A0A0A8L4R1_9SACH|nr:unnamed protein product [Kluyveromyces dobzhanskii CBS 2104]